MDVGNLLTGRTRETAIRRDAQGRWWNGAEPIDHPKVARSFDAWVERSEDGRLCLVNDVNWAYVEIEGAPYFVRSVAWEGDHAVLTLSGDRVEQLDASTLRVGPEGVLHCDVRDGSLAAQFDNHAAMQLGTRIVSDDEGEVLLLGAERHRIVAVDDPLSTLSGSS